MADYHKLTTRWGSYSLESGGRCSNGIRNRSTVNSPEFTCLPDPNTKTVYEAFRHGLAISPDGNCLGRRLPDRFDFYTFNEINTLVDKLAITLSQKSGVKPKDCIGIYSANSPEWCATGFSAASASFILVPLYDTLGAQACADIISEVSMSVLLADTYAAVDRILHQIDGLSTPSLKTIVVLSPRSDDLAAKTREAGAAKSIEIVPLDEYIKDADLNALDTLKRSTTDDIYMIQYTSGTTGRPKGVMLTHGNFMANVGAVHDMYRRPDGTSAVDTPKMVCLHYLPLAHSYGQLVMLCIVYVGGQVGFFGGNIQKLLDDAALLRPNWLPLVPRLMNKFYSKVHAEVNRKGGIAAKLFHYAYNRKRDMLINHDICTRHSVWDYLVFRKLQAKLGGHVEFMLTSSAPVSPEVLEFWRVVMGATLIEAYGQTEATALVTAAYCSAGGTVGHPVSCNMIKLVDVEELGYFAKERKGEICIKGTNIMKGYYKQPDKTAEALDEDGWLHTGDIGEFKEGSGSLRLIDRKKHIFKLSQGEYIAPEKIEAVYSSCPLVAQVFVDGNSLQSFVVAVVVPDPVEAQEWADATGLKGPSASLAELCHNEEFKAHVLKSLVVIGKAKGLNTLEQVKAIYLHPDPFTVSNDLLTPSMKNRRPQLRSFFKVQIDNLYASNPSK